MVSTQLSPPDQEETDERDKLSECGKKLIKTAIKNKRWDKNHINEELSNAATWHILNNKQTSINLESKLTYIDITTLVDEGWLIEKSTKFRNDYSHLCDPDQNVNIDRKELDMLIQDNLLQGVGVSPATCKRFLAGENINRKGFKILCETLNCEYESVVYKSIEQLSDEEKKKLQLRKALGSLNHQAQWDSFADFIDNRTITLYIKNNSYMTLRSKLLLNCLIQNLNQQQVNVNPCPQPLIVYMKFSTSEEKSPNSSDLLLDQLAKAFKKISNKSKIRPKSSKLLDVVYATVSFLNNYDSIILVFDKIKEPGTEIIQKITNEFWNPLIQRVSPFLINYSHRLFLCYIGSGKENFVIHDSLNQLNQPIYLTINVADSFNREDLSHWMNYHQIRPILQIRREQINIKIEEIWTMLNCGDNVEPEALLKAIYAKCNCEWDEDYWTKWTTPTL